MNAPSPLEHLRRPLVAWRDARLEEPAHDSRTAAVLGAALGICFLTCFVTGIISHLVQHPPGWFEWRTRPAGFYRISQGLHVTTGLAAIPLLLAKLWSVFPRLFRTPMVEDWLHALERLSLLPLVGGSLFMLVTGLANIELWYPWVFFFPAGHYAVSFVVMGALLIHVTAKWATTRSVLVRSVQPSAARRQFLGAVVATSAGLVGVTAGQTVWPLRKVGLLAPRRPDTGVQGFPVNKTAIEAGVTTVAADPAYRLDIEAGGRTLRSFTLEELRALPARSANLPIACVEGWSANRRWTGVPVRDLLALAGAPAGGDVSVESVQRGGRYRRSTLTAGQADDRDALLAMYVDGEPLHLDHGYPVRLIVPNRPGVLQTKWVARLVVS